MVVLRGLLCAAVLMVMSRPAAAWWYVEHEQIGTEVYLQACKRLKEALPAQTADEEADEGAHESIHRRYQIACGNLAVKAKLYGQACALSGDRLDRPEDFLARGGDWKAASRQHYLVLQLVDVHHFHPSSLREWMNNHRIALDHAINASKKIGLDAVGSFEQAFYRSAYADHFLHDSYAAGHMGFNRSASSIAASTRFHNIWNKRGRQVQNRRGQSWITYGDGLLNDPKNAEGRQGVIDGASESVFSMIATYVFGKRDHDRELAAWNHLPFLIEARTSPSLLGLDPDSEEEEAAVAELQPTLAVNRPARVDEVLDVAIGTLGNFDTAPETLYGLVGFDAALPLLGTRAHLSVGATRNRETDTTRLAGQVEIRKPLGHNFDGLVTHHLSSSFLWELRKSEIAGWVASGYMLQLELGLDLLQLQAAPTWSVHDREFGFATGIGYGRVLGVAGGGVR